MGVTVDPRICVGHAKLLVHLYGIKRAVTHGRTERTEWGGDVRELMRHAKAHKAK